MRAVFLRLVAASVALHALAACGEDTTQTVGPAIHVVATHFDEEGRKLLDYGPVPVLVPESRTLTVFNRGLAPLTVRSLAISTTDDAFYPKEDLPPGGLRIEPGGEAALEILFRPPAETTFEGTLVIEHDDAKQEPVEVRLIGEGSTVGRVEVTPLELDFGRVGEGTQVERAVSIRSVGTARLIIESIELSGAPEFSILGSTTTPVELPPPADGNPGGSVDLLIACAPNEETASDEEMTGTLTIRTTDPDAREVVVQLRATKNEAPVAVIGETSGVPAPGDSIALDGLASSDPDGDLPLTWAWRVHRAPFGSEAYIDEPSSPTPNLVTDEPGEYVVGLDVADSTGLPCLHPDLNPAIPCATRTITVKPADDLEIRLTWDHSRTDLDLHVREPGAPIGSSRDCHYGNPTPDFGVQGDLSDDPRHTGDVLAGFGPEKVLFSQPSDGQRVQATVIFTKTNGAPDPATAATLRVYVYGVLAAEMTRTLTQAGEQWDVLTIEWPSAEITPIDTVAQVMQ